MAAENFIIPSDQKNKINGYQEEWLRFLEETNSDEMSKVFGDLSGVSLSFKEYSNLVVVGAKNISLKFGIEQLLDEPGSPYRFLCILYALDSKNRQVSDYVVVGKPITGGSVDPGEISDQLEQAWYQNWTRIQQNNHFKQVYFEVPGLLEDYSELRNRLIQGYTFEVQEMVDILFPSLADDTIHEVQILIGLHGGFHAKDSDPSPTCTFGVVFHAADETGHYLKDGGGGYFDIGTPCPDVCPS